VSRTALEHQFGTVPGPIHLGGAPGWVPAPKLRALTCELIRHSASGRCEVFRADERSKMVLQERAGNRTERSERPKDPLPVGAFQMASESPNRKPNGTIRRVTRSARPGERSKMLRERAARDRDNPPPLGVEARVGSATLDDVAQTGVRYEPRKPDVVRTPSS